MFPRGSGDRIRIGTIIHSSTITDKRDIIGGGHSSAGTTAAKINNSDTRTTPTHTGKKMARAPPHRCQLPQRSRVR